MTGSFDLAMKIVGRGVTVAAAIALLTYAFISAAALVARLFGRIRRDRP